MKTPKFMAFWVCLALAIFTSSATHGQSHEDPKIFTGKLEDEFLGLHLGCSLEELQRELKKSENPIKLIKKKVVMGMTNYIYSGNHRLNGATKTFFSFWHGKLTIVGVYFITEEAAKIFDALKIKMEEKYAKMTDEINFSGKQCTLTKGGMYFTLDLEINPFETDKVSLLAAHVGIIATKEAKEADKKADDLGNL